MKKVLLGMSGGVDSSVSALCLQRDGYEVIGVTLVFHAFKKDIEAQAKAAEVCEKLGIEHRIVDVQDEFKAVVEADFIKEYEQGLTPNPCAFCNRTMKFPSLVRAADSLGCDFIATGHYANITQDTEGVGLKPYQLRVPFDEYKDQSYMLYGLTQDILARTIFPLNNISKPIVRKMEMRAGLGFSEISESQDICFIEGDDYAAWLDEHGINAEPGNVMHMGSGKVLGQHNGLHHYTIGQRKGLNVGGGTGEPLYVIAKDPISNSLFVGPENLQATESCKVRDLVWTSIEAPSAKRSCKVKIRYRSKAVPCQIVPMEDGGVQVFFNDAARAVAPGQVAVFYSDGMVMGGGIIC